MMKIKTIAIILLLWGIIGCESNQDKKAVHSEKEIAVKQSKFIDASVIKNLRLDEIEKRYKPFKSAEFPLNEASISEFRIALNNHFNTQQRQQTTLIKEVTWKLNSSTFLTIWFIEKQNKWEQIEQYEWKEGTEF